jgi:hypothetical protein
MYFSYCSHVFVKNSFLGTNELLQSKCVGLKFEIDTCLLYLFVLVDKSEAICMMYYVA